jgi:hypothetical protein
MYISAYRKLLVINEYLLLKLISKLVSGEVYWPSGPTGKTNKLGTKTLDYSILGYKGTKSSCKYGG